jgi:hypothetical protein
MCCALCHHQNMKLPAVFIFYLALLLPVVALLEVIYLQMIMDMSICSMINPSVKPLY